MIDSIESYINTAYTHYGIHTLRHRIWKSQRPDPPSAPVCKSNARNQSLIHFLFNVCRFTPQKTQEAICYLMYLDSLPFPEIDARVLCRRYYRKGVLSSAQPQHIVGRFGTGIRSPALCLVATDIASECIRPTAARKDVHRQPRDLRDAPQTLVFQSGVGRGTEYFPWRKAAPAHFCHPQSKKKSTTMVHLGN